LSPVAQSNLHWRHTVEELQSFSNVRTPSPPWVHVVRLVIPMSSCDEAAVYLIRAFRGEQVMKRVVGGTKWWQVRGIRGYVLRLVPDASLRLERPGLVYLTSALWQIRCRMDQCQKRLARCEKTRQGTIVSPD
jgi:hypothetical protein